MAGVADPESAWTGRVTPGLVAAFEAGRSRLAPAGLTVALVQVRWRRLPPTVRVTVRVTDGPDGRPQVDVVTRPGLAADHRRRR